jgi:transcriptional regulator with XRE-family HTH domain
MARDSAFGRYLRGKRQRARLSLRAVAEKLGVTHVYLGEVERGVRLAVAAECMSATRPVRCRPAR